MAVYTLAPLAGMLARVDREILVVVIEGGRRPGRLAVTGGAIRGKLRLRMIGIGRLLKVRLVAPKTRRWRVVVIAVVARGAFVGDQCMRAIERVIVVVHGESRRIPVGIRRMAHRTVVGQAQRCMVGVQGLVEVGLVTGRTGCRRARVAIRVALDTFGRQVYARERECGLIVVENVIRVAGRMAGQAGGIAVRVAVDIRMVLVRLRVEVARNAGKLGIVIRVAVAIGAGIPLPFMATGVNGEIQQVVFVEFRRHPAGCRGMAGRAIRRKPERHVRRI